MGATEQYLIQEGKAVKRKSQQVFTTSTEATIENVEALLDTMQEEPRQFSVAEKNCLLLVCGETNILYKPKGGTIGFRYPNDTKLLSRFNKLMKQTDIVLNPMHSPWRRHADLKARILYLSKGRYFFGTSNTCKKISLKAHLIHAFHNEEELIGKEEIQSQYRSTIYNI